VLRSFDYSLVPRNALFSASYGFEERFNIPVSIHGLAGYNWFDVIIDDNLFPFDYTPAQGARFGAALSHAAPARDSRSLISPRGLYAKIKYEFWYQNLINEEKPFLSDKGWVAENYDDYRYNQVTASLKMGMPMPWSPKQALYGELWGTGLALTSACRADLRDNPDLETDRLPSYFQPVGWLPGYVYYYRDTVSIRNRYDTTGTATIDKALDTVLLSGDAVAQVKLSYRFPLWPRSIDKKLGFLYLDLLYGAVNVNMGRAWGAPMQIIDNIRSLGDEGRFADLFRDEWLKSAGAEVRLETVSFGTFPLAFYTRWDWGFDRAAPIGGHKFTVGLGFSFDNWEYIDLPDYGMRGGAPGR